MTKKLKIKKLFSFIFVISCIFISLFILWINNNDNYRFLFLFPIVFSISYVSYFKKKFQNNVSPFYIVFFIILFVRYVVMTLLVVLTGYSSNSKAFISSYSYTIAQILMIVELLSINIFLIIFDLKKKNVIEDNKKKLSNNNDFIIIIFCLFFLTFPLLFSNVRSSIYLFAPSISTSLKFDALNEVEKTLLMLFDIAKQFLSLFIIKRLSIKYSESKHNIYFCLALFVAFFNIFIFTSTNRIDFLILSLSSLYMLAVLFNKSKKILIFTAVIIGLIVIPMISSFRSSNSLVSKNMTLNELSKEFNAYLSGVDNVAISVMTAEQFNNSRDFRHFLNDLSRSTIGLNLIMKKYNITLSNAYFNYVWFGDRRAPSQIIPLIGQGYFYFGIVGFWIYELIFLAIAMKLDKHKFNTKNIYLKYFTLAILLRFSMMQGLNGTILMNGLSFEYLIPLLIVNINDKIYVKKS